MTTERQRSRFTCITDLLVAEGFSIDTSKQIFRKGNVEIPFPEISRHTVASFIEKARARGWIESPESEQDPEFAAQIAKAMGVP